MYLYVEDLINLAETDDYPRVQIVIIDNDLAREKEINYIRFNKEEEILYIDVSDGM